VTNIVELCNDAKKLLKDNRMMAALSSLTDQELLTSMKEGSERALEEVISRYWDKLLAIAINRLDDLEEAEECLQDVFFNLWKRRESLALKYSLGTYLSVAVRYQSRDILQKQYRRTRRAEGMELLVENTMSASPEELILEKELWLQLEATVRQLPEKCQIVYRLSREEGKSNKEIAAELNISENTVENHIARALKDIRGTMNATLPGFVAWFFGHYL
jgi:RNA polymerase sigma-70 factor (family 1)